MNDVRQDWLGSIRWMPCYNSGEETIPPFGLVQIESLTHSGNRPLVGVGAPQQDHWQAGMAVNGPVSLPAGEHGLCSSDFPLLVRYDAEGETPAIGEQWGPASGEFDARPDGTGLTILAIDAVHGRLFVVASGLSAAWREGRLLTALAVATGGGSGATEAALELFRPGGGWTATGTTVTVVNRDPTLSLAAGTYVQVVQQSGEWRIIWAACSPREVGCGSVTYRWQSGGEEQTGQAAWQTRRTADSSGCGFEAWLWNDGHSGGGARWVRSAGCGEGCTSSTAPPDDGVVHGQIVLRPCGSWEWYIVANDCLCGAAPVPPSGSPDPGFESTPLLTPCAGGTCGEWQWVQTTGHCECGSAAAPDWTGTEYQEVMVPCV